MHIRLHVSHRPVKLTGLDLNSRALTMSHGPQDGAECGGMGWLEEEGQGEEDPFGWGGLAGAGEVGWRGRERSCAGGGVEVQWKAGVAARLGRVRKFQQVGEGRWGWEGFVVGWRGREMSRPGLGPERDVTRQGEWGASQTGCD